VNYDIGHATVEGGYGGWRNTFKLCAPHLKGIAIKDFKWTATSGGMAAALVPIGQRMVNFKQYLRCSGPPVLRAGPDALRVPSGGVENGATKLSISNEETFKSMRRDSTRFGRGLRSFRCSLELASNVHL